MNEARFKSLIMPLHKRLFAYALSILHDESDAADCLQEAFTRLWEHRSHLAHLENIEAYATVTVRNIAVNLLLRTRRRPDFLSSPPPEMPDIAPDPADSLEEREKIRVLASMLRTLPDNQRKVVMMSAVSGLSNTEIHEATGLSDDNVRVLLSRGRKKLRQLFANFMKDG